MNFKKGFTLIELLVVVAIIGILSSVVLASLNSARTKGADASIKANLSSARGQAELYYADNSNSYLGVCATDLASPLSKSIKSMIDGAKASAGITTATGVNTAGASATATCNASASAWAVEVPMKGTATNFFCIDSAGVAKEENATSLSNATDYTCI